MAQLVFLAQVDPSLGVTAGSAGTGALVGNGIDASCALVLRRRGLDPNGHRARHFRPRFAERADLVLTADATQRDWVMGEVPSAFRRTFTLKEFARLAGHLDTIGAAAPAPIVEVVARVARIRGIDGSRPPSADDIADPYRGPVEQAAATLADIDSAVGTTVRLLGLGAARPAATARRRPRPF